MKGNFVRAFGGIFVRNPESAYDPLKYREKYKKIWQNFVKIANVKKDKLFKITKYKFTIDKMKKIVYFVNRKRM